MKEYFLRVSRTKDCKINLNSAYLSVFENDEETVLIRSIESATEKGWKSRKPIFEELDVVYQESECQLIITEECANMLIEKYANVSVKIYTAHIAPPSAAHVIANFITKNLTDPYDRG